MLAPVKSEHDDCLIVNETKVDGVGEPMKDRSARLALHLGKCERSLDDTSQRRIDLVGELVTQVELARLVPLTRLQDIGLCFGPEQNTANHSASQLAPNFLPRNGGTRIRHVVIPAPVKLGKQFRVQRQRGLAFRMREALPKRHGQFRTRPWR
jgi:hypothetical protein